MFQSTVSLVGDGIDESRERIGEIEEARAELEAFSEENYDHEALRPERLQTQIDAYDDEIESMEGRINVFERVIDEWGDDDPTFEIRMLRGNELAQLQDVGVGEGGVGGEASIDVLRRTVEAGPESAPTDENGDPAPGEYPWPVTVWLFQKINSLNGTGDPNFMDGGPL